MSNEEMTAKINEWVLGNQHILFTVLDQFKMPKYPEPLPPLKKLFKMFKNPEDYADDEEDEDGISEEFKEEMKKQEESINDKEDVHASDDKKDEL